MATMNGIELAKMTQEEFRGSVDELLREAVRGVLIDVMEAEITEFLGAGRYERSKKRRGSRNGHQKDRGLETRVGSIELPVPRDRAGEFQTRAFERYHRLEKPLEESLVEMYLKGVSTRKVSAITEKLCGLEMTASRQSQLNQTLAEELEAWRERPLRLSYPYLFLDALYLDVRWGQEVEGYPVLVAYGVNDKGYRELIGVGLGNAESADSWTGFLRGLLRRGLSGVLLVTSDAHEGIKAALKACLPEALWQRCIVHFMRNILTRVPHGKMDQVGKALHEIFQEPSKAKALAKAREIEQRYEKMLPEAMKTLREGLDDALRHYEFPEAHRVRIRTTNPLERLNREIRRRTNVVGVFPTEGSCLLLVAAVLKAQTEEWSRRRYLDMALLVPRAQAALTMIETKKQVATKRRTG